MGTRKHPFVHLKSATYGLECVHLYVNLMEKSKPPVMVGSKNKTTCNEIGAIHRENTVPYPALMSW